MNGEELEGLIKPRDMSKDYYEKKKQAQNSDYVERQRAPSASRNILKERIPSYFV